MKCRDCKGCKLGYFKSKPDKYVCTGVKEPFVIEDIDKECTEYPGKPQYNLDLKLKPEQVAHPNHYGGKNNPYEAIKVIRAWGLGFDLGNVVKYISRMGKKDLKGDVLESSIEDLKKARFYLDDEIKHMEAQLEAIKYQE